MQIFEQVIESPDDVFQARQRSREVAAVLGFEESDQVRVATALSEVGRDIITNGRHGRIAYVVDLDEGQLVIDVDGFGSTAEADGQGVAAARRLKHAVSIESTGPHEVRVTLRRRLPAGVRRADLSSMRTRLESMLVLSPLDELRSQNRQLVETLDEVQAARQTLEVLNEELEETNRGVMAMYAQISDELDSTNRGVVALYAELDDTTRQLRAASEAKSRFLSSISHELRSPINSMVGLSQLLLASVGSTDDVAERRRGLELIESSGRELLELVTQLLDLAKAESGRLDVQTAPRDIVPVLNDVVASLVPTARRGVRVHHTVHEPAIVIDTDDKLLRQVVRNLVGNAIAFTEQGSVEVSARCDADGTVTIAVHDSGIGIAEDDLERIFEEFYQVRGPLQNRRRGTGLGLPYARKVVQALGGQLDATSQVGVGSTFSIRLPPGSRLATSSAEAAPSMVRRALIVDDDPTFRDVLARLLTPIAREVEQVSDGAAALAAVRASEIDVVFLDLSMPDMSGDEVLRRMGADPALDHTKVVVVTSHHVDQAARASMPRAAAVLNKQGLTTSELAAAVRRAQEEP